MPSMFREGLEVMQNNDLLLCDLTQSWSETGGGIGIYIRQKRQFIEQEKRFRHLLIVPGKEDLVYGDGRLTIAEVASPLVPGSPNYRCCCVTASSNGSLAS